MEDLMERLTQLGRAVSEVSDRKADPLVLETARRRWLQPPMPAPVRRPSMSRRMALVAAPVCLAAVLLVVTARRTPGSISFAVGTAATPGVVGAWIAANEDSRIPVRFSEGTSLTLKPGAKIRVVETTRHGADVLLEQGSLSASVIHSGPKTRWALRAGPFDVQVTGTQFDASWDPTAEAFELVMTEGRVVVRGPLLPAWREITAGERLRISIREQSMELRTARVDGPAPNVAPEPSVLPSTTAASSATVSTAGNPRPTGVVAPSKASEGTNWRDLASAGKYRDALAAAERVGLEETMNRSSASDLLLLSDAARYAARPAVARQALMAMRNRFGARGRTAFLLGKIAADQQGSVSDAIRWFEIYLREEPNGSLAEQALGRILELRKGDREAAQPIAKRYLARYPGGAYAPLARSLVTP